MSDKRIASPALDTPGQRIRFLRLALEMTQETLAKRVYATQAAVSRWENDHDLPSRPAQVLIAQELNTTRAFLFGELAA